MAVAEKNIVRLKLFVTSGIVVVLPFFADINAEVGGKNGNIAGHSSVVVLDKQLLGQVFGPIEDFFIKFTVTSSAMTKLHVGDVIVAGVSSHTPYGMAPRVIIQIAKTYECILVSTKPITIERAIQGGTIHLNN